MWWLKRFIVPSGKLNSIIKRAVVVIGIQNDGFLCCYVVKKLLLGWRLKQNQMTVWCNLLFLSSSSCSLPASGKYGQKFWESVFLLTFFLSGILFLLSGGKKWGGCIMQLVHNICPGRIKIKVQVTTKKKKNFLFNEYLIINVFYIFFFFLFFVRESIYRLLPQTTPENINKNFDQYTIDPGTRYPNLNSSCVRPHQVSTQKTRLGNHRCLLFLLGFFCPRMATSST